MARILYVSKPIAPPWNDGSKNIVRDVARHLPSRHQAWLMGRSDQLGEGELAPARLLPVHPLARSRFTPSASERMRTLLTLLVRSEAELWHFFFAPSSATSRAVTLLRTLRRRPSVHTVCSAPHPAADPSRLLLAETTVVLSEHTERRYLEAGVPPSRLRRIPTPLSPPPPPSAERIAQVRATLSLPAGAPVVLYVGDLEEGGGAERILAAFERLPPPLRDEVHLVLACRAKTPRAETILSSLRSEVARRPHLAARVRWAGEVPFIYALLAASDVVTLPVDSLFAKVDHPLVLLEAMSLGRPVLVCEGTPAAELAQGGALVVPQAPEAVAEGIGRLLDDEPDARARGERGRLYVRSEHDPRRIAEAYAVLYDELSPG